MFKVIQASKSVLSILESLQDLRVTCQLEEYKDVLSTVKVTYVHESGHKLTWEVFTDPTVCKTAFAAISGPHPKDYDYDLDSPRFNNPQDLKVFVQKTIGDFEAYSKINLGQSNEASKIS